ncbi:MAG TPA: TetR/AcrR family transcriptional regulator [Phototrophicaceae bacterium]|nr:TetR/AcrR family transcriptional regulator [Phototrophicaceae bacterium]
MTLHASSTDPRTRRTLALLERAMSSLLETQSISTINVSELCRVAGIHRTTFYKHFSSVAEFATTMFARLFDDLAVVSEEELPDSFEEVPEYYRRALVRMLDHIAANRPVFSRLFASGGDHHLQRIIADVMSERTREAHHRMAARGWTLPIDEDTAAHMVGAACTAAMGVWAAQDGGDSEARSREVMAALPSWWQVA